MRLRHIEVINAIRITGTVKAAAALLSLSQPAVTQEPAKCGASTWLSFI